MIVGSGRFWVTSSRLQAKRPAVARESLAPEGVALPGPSSTEIITQRSGWGTSSYTPHMVLAHGPSSLRANLRLPLQLS